MQQQQQHACFYTCAPTYHAGAVLGTQVGLCSNKVKESSRSAKRECPSHAGRGPKLAAATETGSGPA
eukprot:1137031-Pelagomonas_calceolata.AAC.3